MTISFPPAARERGLGMRVHNLREASACPARFTKVGIPGPQTMERADGTALTLFLFNPIPSEPAGYNSDNPPLGLSPENS